MSLFPSAVGRVASGSSRSSYLRAVRHALATRSASTLADSGISSWSDSHPSTAELRAIPMHIPEDVLAWRPRVRAPSASSSPAAAQTKPEARLNASKGKGPVMRAADELLSQPDEIQDVTDDSAALEPFEIEIAQVDDSPTSRSSSKSIKWKATPRQGLPRRVRPDQAPSEPEGPIREAMLAYHERYRSLIEAEQKDQWDLLQERLRRPAAELSSSGLCLQSLSAFWLEETQYGLPVSVFSKGPGVSLGNHDFDNGTQVILSRISPLEPDFVIGTVVGKTPTQLRIAFQNRFVVDDGTWRLDVASSDITFVRMRAALDNMHYDPAHLAAQSTPEQELMLLGTYLRDQLLHSFIPSSPSLEEGTPGSRSKSSLLSEDQRLHSWAQRYQRSNPIVMDGDPVVEGMNASQMGAIASMLGNRLSLVQGPPGTGKSRTIVEAIKLLKKHFHVKAPILVCTFTNTAVDNLVASFSTSEIQPLRVGFAARVPQHLHSYTLDAQIEHHPNKPNLEKVVKQIGVMDRKMESIERSLESVKASDAKRKEDLVKRKRVTAMKLGGLRGRKWAMERAMMRDIIDKSDVICTTMVASASSALQIMDFPIVFIDEASMSTEPASLIPIMRGSQHVALVGDHHQLPPIVTSPLARSGGLAISLFERLASEGRTPLVMLDEQYRMHPSISKFPNTEFYGRKLKDGTIDAEGAPGAEWTPPLSAFYPVVSSPVDGAMHAARAVGGDRLLLGPSAVFLDHQGPESRKGRSLVNVQEAEIARLVVEDLLIRNPDLTGRDIGIISPYLAQIQHLISLFHAPPSSSHSSIHHQQHASNPLSLQTQQIEISTVDGFEGREKPVIIFSTVRSNPSGHIGFLADRRRLNVGLTRARRGLFVLGNTETLMKGRVSAFGDLGGEKDVVDMMAERQRMDDAGVWARFVGFMRERSLVRTFDRSLMVGQGGGGAGGGSLLKV